MLWIVSSMANASTASVNVFPDIGDTIVPMVLYDYNRITLELQ